MRVDFRKAEFVTSAADRKGFRLDKPAVLFAGRSNAGKSTLINLLCGRKNLMKVSSTPGKTRLVNYALVDDAFYLCDCPGYGFESKRDYFQKLMDDYFEASSHTLKGVVLVVDSRRGVLSSDEQMIEYCRSWGVKVLIVLTKIDKLNRSQVAQVVADIHRDYPDCDTVCSSSLRPEMIDTVRNEVGKLALKR